MRIKKLTAFYQNYGQAFTITERKKKMKEKNQKSKIRDLWRRSKGLTSEGLIIWTLGKRHSAHKCGFT